MLDPSFKACKTVALLPQKMWDDEFWCVVGADTTVCRRGLILPGLRRYQQSLTLNCVVPALKCLILPVWNLLKTQGLIHFWGGCWRQMKDAAVSSPELLILKKKKQKKQIHHAWTRLWRPPCRAFSIPPLSGSFVRPRTRQPLTFESMHDHFHLCDWDLKGEEGGSEVVCVCVFGKGGGGCSLLVTTCFFSLIHLSPQTISSPSSKEQNWIKTCGTELKDNETLSRCICCWKAASSCWQRQPSMLICSTDGCSEIRVTVVYQRLAGKVLWLT